MKIDVFNRPQQKVAVFVKKKVSNDRKSNTVSFLVVRKKKNGKYAECLFHPI